MISPAAPAAALEELLNPYNLATTLDPALVALACASPFYEGKALGLAVHTAYYRGSALLGCEGLYTHLPEVDDLQPYAKSVRELVGRQLAGYEAWLVAMDRTGVERCLFFESGGNALKASWNPVRLNQHGTVELRAIDCTYPEVRAGGCRPCTWRGEQGQKGQSNRRAGQHASRLRSGRRKSPRIGLRISRRTPLLRRCDKRGGEPRGLCLPTVMVKIVTRSTIPAVRKETSYGVYLRIRRSQVRVLPSAPRE